jgi:hypothetical protein
LLGMCTISCFIGTTFPEDADKNISSHNALQSTISEVHCCPLLFLLF